MSYSQLVRSIEYFEDELLKSSGEKFQNISNALEAMRIIRNTFEAKKEG